MLSNNNNYPNGGFERIDKRVVMTKSVVGQTDWGADLTIIFNQALEKNKSNIIRNEEEE